MSASNPGSLGEDSGQRQKKREDSKVETIFTSNWLKKPHMYIRCILMIVLSVS